MIIEPVMRGYICLAAHPKGCAENVRSQIAFTTSRGTIEGPKNVLVIGASTGFGLASRITSAFGAHAATIGVFYEKPAHDDKTASPGWYNTAAFHQEAKKAGLYAKSINGDAFSSAIKKKTVDLIKKDLGSVDLVIYSIASPVRNHPITGITHHSVLKPIDKPYSNKSVDVHTGVVSTTTIAPASDEEIAHTVAVMGGEDWYLWMEALLQADALSHNATTVAYSYIGASITDAIYRSGTIGRAKDHLEKMAATITKNLSGIHGRAFVSVNKALVTQASAAIPAIPLYISLLFKVMKEKGLHEGCIEQTSRLFADRLFTGKTVPTDEQGRIRLDDWEMRDDVQSEVAALWNNATTQNLPEIGDLQWYRSDFLALFGFVLPGIDYTADVNEAVEIDGLE